ncbi:MAG: hypothetical protein KKG59_02105 [Nanoarchaeota archaeon]|nr:hypothetical protein [Nanoarchaeota archaeon]
MGQTVEINAKTFLDLKDKLLHYFMTLSPYEQYAWMAIALGVVLIIGALILW